MGTVPGNTGKAATGSGNSTSTAKIDGTTGQVKSSSGSGHFSLPGQEGNALTFIPHFEMESHHSMTLTDTDNEVDPNTIDNVKNMINGFSIILHLNPFTNRTGLDPKPTPPGEENIQPQDNPVDAEGVIEITNPDKPLYLDPQEEIDQHTFNLPDELDRRRLQEIYDVIVLRKDIFEVNLVSIIRLALGVDLNCKSNDKCKAKVYATLIVVDITLLQKTFEFQASKVAKTYQYIKVFVLDTIINVADVVDKTVILINTTTNNMQTGVDLFQNEFVKPLQRACDRFNNIANTIHGKVLQMTSFMPKLQAALDTQLQRFVLGMERSHNLAVNDMELIGSDLQQIYHYFQTLLDGETISQELLDEILFFLDSIDTHYFDYVQKRAHRYDNTVQAINQFLEDIATQIDEIPNTPLFQSSFGATNNLTKMAEIFQIQYTDLKADLRLLYKKYYENFAIRFSGDIIALGHEFFDLKEAAKVYI